MAASAAAVDHPPPTCEACRACVSVRVVVDDFRATAACGRVLDRNADVVGRCRGADLRAILGFPPIGFRHT
jgi:arginyl-tRNA--protein-N-Asp/Glu arginylyltransferase